MKNGLFCPFYTWVDTLYFVLIGAVSKYYNNLEKLALIITSWRVTDEEENSAVPLLSILVITWVLITFLLETTHNLSLPKWKVDKGSSNDAYHKHANICRRDNSSQVLEGPSRARKTFALPHFSVNCNCIL